MFLLWKIANLLLFLSPHSLLQVDLALGYDPDNLNQNKPLFNLFLPEELLILSSCNNGNNKWTRIYAHFLWSRMLKNQGCDHTLGEWKSCCRGFTLSECLESSTTWRINSYDLPTWSGTSNFVTTSFGSINFAKRT